MTKKNNKNQNKRRSSPTYLQTSQVKDELKKYRKKNQSFADAVDDTQHATQQQSELIIEEKPSISHKDTLFTDLYHERANISSKIMKIISQPNQSINGLGKKQQIIKFLDEHKQLYDGAKKEFYDTFENGIHLNTKIFKQTRVQQAFKDSLITFHPTKMTTGWMFHRINQKGRQTLITGHFGISKTFSTMLYQKLSNYIIDYKMRTNPGDICKEIIKVKRLFYFTLQQQLTDTQQKFNKSIYSQLLDSQKKYFDKNKSFQQNWEILSDAYQQREIQICLVIDQFNAFVSEARQTGYTKKQFKSGKEQFKRVIAIQKIIRQKIRQGFSMMYLSSVNIEYDLLSKLYIVKDPKHNREIPYQVSINFLKNLKKQQNRLQLIDYFIDVYDSFFKSQITALVLKQNNSLYKKKQQFYNAIRKLLFQQWKTTKSFYVNQLVIHQTIKKMWDSNPNLQQNFGFEQKIQSLQILKNKIILLFEEIIRKNMPLKLQEKVQRFYNKTSINQTQRLLFIQQLYEKFQEHKERQKNPSDTKQIIENSIPYVQKKKYENMINFLDQHLFAIEDDKISLAIPPEVFFKLRIKTGLTKFQLFIQYAVEYLAKHMNDTILKTHFTRSGKGGFFENIMKTIMTQGYSSLIIKNNTSSRVIKEFRNISKNVGIFNTINSEQNFDFLQNIREGLKSMIQKAQKQNLQEVNQLFLPVKKNTQQCDNSPLSSIKQNTHETSKAIDFMVINYGKKQKKFHIYSFDVSISKTPKKIADKVINFLQSYEKLKNKNQNSMKINDQNYSVELYYYTITPEKDFQMTAYVLNLKLQYRKDYQFKQIADPDDKVNDKITFAPTNKTKKFLLKEISHLCLDKNIFIQNKQRNNILEFKLYQQLLEEQTNNKNDREVKTETTA